MSLWTRNETFLLSSVDKKAYRRCCSGCPLGDDDNVSFWWHSLNSLPFRDAKCLESHFRLARTCSDPIATKATKHCRTISRGNRRNDMVMVGCKDVSEKLWDVWTDPKATTCVWIQRRWTQNLRGRRRWRSGGGPADVYSGTYTYTISALSVRYLMVRVVGELWS